MVLQNSKQAAGLEEGGCSEFRFRLKVIKEKEKSKRFTLKGTFGRNSYLFYF